MICKLIASFFTRFAGITVKVHEHREALKNALLARERLLAKLDEQLNGDNSIANQIKRIDEARREKLDKKAEKRRDLKKAFKEREGLC